jgi:hypothetical protein
VGKDKYILIFHRKTGRNKAAWKSQPRVGEEYKEVSKGKKIEIRELDLSGSRQGPITRSFERVYASTGSTKRAKFIYWLRNYKPPKR